MDTFGCITKVETLTPEGTTLNDKFPVSKATKQTKQTLPLFCLMRNGVEWENAIMAFAS